VRIHKHVGQMRNRVDVYGNRGVSDYTIGRIIISKCEPNESGRDPCNARRGI